MHSFLSETPLVSEFMILYDRFIMSFIMKLQVAVVLHKYDIKMNNKLAYKDNWVGTVCMPDKKAEILYRNRSS